MSMPAAAYTHGQKFTHLSTLPLYLVLHLEVQKTFGVSHTCGVSEHNRAQKMHFNRGLLPAAAPPGWPCRRPPGPAGAPLGLRCAAGAHAALPLPHPASPESRCNGGNWKF